MYLPAPDEALHVAVLRMVLRMPGNRSIKDRRRVVVSLRDRVHARHHAAFADVGHLDRADAAVVAVTIVGNDARLLRARLDTVRAEVEHLHEALLTESSVEVLTLNGHR
ncbi:MAG: DUF503 domain-containing protein [Myxococcota bacterium]